MDVNASVKLNLLIDICGTEPGTFLLGALCYQHADLFSAVVYLVLYSYVLVFCVKEKKIRDVLMI